MRHSLLWIVSVLLLTSTITADARLIRGGGRGSSAAPVSSGLATYLLPVDIESEMITDEDYPGLLLLPPGFDTESQFARYQKFDFNSDYQGGWHLQTHHNWGQECAEPMQTPASTPTAPDHYDCYFELAVDEVLEWDGHAIGLPEEREDTAQDAYLAQAVLDYQWTLRERDDDFGTVNTLLTWNDTDPETVFGNLLAFEDSEDAGCFAVFQVYTSGYCQEFGLDTGLTGADLAALFTLDVLQLRLEVTLTAPDGYAFYNLVDSTQPEDPTPLVFLQRGGSISAEEDGAYLFEHSNWMRIEIVPSRGNPVPSPGTVLLLLAGTLVLRRRRRA